MHWTLKNRVGRKEALQSLLAEGTNIEARNREDFTPPLTASINKKTVSCQTVSN
jgi:hypothetical protein